MSRSRTIVLIDEIHLSGFEHCERSSLADALERELVRQFGSRPIDTGVSGGASRAARPRRIHADHVTTAPLQLQPGASSAALALQLAERIHGATAGASRRVKGRG